MRDVDIHVHTTLSGRWLCPRGCPPIPKPTTPNNLGPNDLGPNDIFIFGSNTAGIHGGGAAKFAKLHFGALYGRGEGLAGNSYAFPTLNADSKGGLKLVKRTDVELATSAAKLHTVITERQDLVFWLTLVGCGLACYTPAYMRTFFEWMDLPNLIKPKGW